MANSSPLQRIRQLEQERAGLIANAKKEAFARAQQAVADLNALGFDYSIVEKKRSAVRGTRKGARRIKDAPCPICKFKTSPPHDARAHRAQGKRKKPFLAQELKDRGYVKA
jgi:hypothetical protein